MKNLKLLPIGLCGFFLAALGASSVLAQEIPYIETEKPKPETLTTKNIDPITNIFARSRLAPNLACEISARKLTQLRKFTTGEKYIEMIEVEFKSESYGGRSMKTYFPVGSKLERVIRNSQFSGPVEEIRVYAGDRLDNSFVVQHDGRGHIVWTGSENIHTTIPCALK